MRHYISPRLEAAKAIASRRQLYRTRRDDAYVLLDGARDDLARHCARLLRGESPTGQTGREMLADARVLASAELLINERVTRLLEMWRRARERVSA